MWGRHRKGKASRIDTLVGQQTELVGDLCFSGGLHVDGTIRGNVVAAEGDDAVLMLSEHGRIEGEVRVPNIILNGTVLGDVHAAERIELAPRARVTGNVFYQMIEMAMGAEVNGRLVHGGQAEEAQAAPKLVDATAEAESINLKVSGDS
ncbi:polymer-forming cytoskeletal protein [Thiohalobacter sp. IOR34]|uniref:bactofilin family protein n=1 Tax=Thiohalobacter sp. IOR34 TaxID=3057176 RepID=UPI0025AF060C|nr:polymer-forming cytoskeletal protein [Thiohalobacter sp. IOR34]WJW75134.1 polymer-forming cytoskeletal protein [Thiohalobacter sp. IOR34]